MVSGPYSRTCAVPHGLNWRCKVTTLPRFIRVFARRVEIGNTALWLERVELRSGPHLLCPSGWICASRRIIPTTSWNEAARELILNCTPQGRDGQERDLFSSGWLEGLSADRYEHRMRLGGFDLASIDSPAFTGGVLSEFKLRLSRVFLPLSGYVPPYDLFGNPDRGHKVAG